MKQEIIKFIDKKYKQSEKPENVFEIVTSGIDGNIGEKAIYKNIAQEDLINILK